MLKKCCLLVCLLLFANCVAEQRSRVFYSEQGEPFISVWEVEAGYVIKLPLVEGFNYDFVVDWGDGSQSEITSADDPDKIHKYANTGNYTVRISGLVEAWSFPMPLGDYEPCKITSVPDLGDVGWKNLHAAFYACRKLAEVQGGDVSQVTSMSGMFYHAWSVVPDTSRWDTSNVIHMSGMFSNTYAANFDTSRWDTSNVINMSYMFYYAVSANPDVSQWDVSNVTDMGSMFARTDSANPDISQWNVSNVTDMNGMFANTVSANPDVSKWDTSNVTNMRYMFAAAKSATPDVNQWDFSKVTCYAHIFGAVTLPTKVYSRFLLRVAETSGKQGHELCHQKRCLKWGWSLSGERWNIPHSPPCIKWEDRLLPLSAGESKYNATAAVARWQLVNRGWIIEDGGQE